MRILMCRPEFFDIEYEINPWMNIRTKADRKRAAAALTQDQFRSLTKYQ